MVQILDSAASTGCRFESLIKRSPSARSLLDSGTHGLSVSSFGEEAKPGGPVCWVCYWCARVKVTTATGKHCSENDGPAEISPRSGIIPTSAVSGVVRGGVSLIFFRWSTQRTYKKHQTPLGGGRGWGAALFLLLEYSTNIQKHQTLISL